MDVARRVDEWIRLAFDAGELDVNPSAQCRVCRDPTITSLVNMMLATACRIPDILDTLKAHNRKLKHEGRPQITSESIINHRERHFDIQAPAYAVYRKIVEKRAVEAGQDWREGVGTVLNAISFLETIGIKGYETLIDPTTVVGYDDGVKAMLKLHEMARQDEGTYERAQMLAEMGRLIELVREFVKPEDWPTLQARLRGDEIVSPAVPQPVSSARVIAIDDVPDDKGN